MARWKKSPSRKGARRPRQAGVETGTTAVSGPAQASPVVESSAGATDAAAHAIIVLEPVITIAEAGALKAQLLPHVGRGGEVVIDGSRVESVDTAALQVLLAFVRSARAHGTVICWNGTSETLLNTAKLLGVARLISLQT